MKNPVIYRVGRSRPPKIGCLLVVIILLTLGITACCTL